MVNSLDGSNPTQLLLNAIRKSGMDMTASGSFKDDETFLLGTFRKDTVRLIVSFSGIPIDVKS